MKLSYFGLAGLAIVVAVAVAIQSRENSSAAVESPKPKRIKRSEDGAPTRPSAPSSGNRIRRGAVDVGGARIEAVKQSTDIPVSLAASIEELSGQEGEDRSENILGIARSWAEIDPHGALSWAFTLEEGINQAAASLVIRDWVTREPAKALQALRSFGESDSHLYTYGERMLFNYWAGHDPAAAWEHVSTVSDVTRRSEIEASILSYWGSVDPVVVAPLLEGIIEESSQHDGLTGAFEITASQWGSMDAGVAASWVEQLPNGVARNAAISGLTGSWLQEDPEAASGWVKGLEAGEGRDSGITMLVVAIRNRDPQAALAWSGSISNLAERRQLATMISLSWLNRDPVAARKAINETNSLTSDDKAGVWAAYDQVADQ